jgi:hypothetical protein
MSLVYRFRVTFEDFDEVSRDIEIKSTQTFEDLHQIIQACIGFDGKKSASFYISNDNWIKGQEIPLEKKTDKEGNAMPLMRDSKLNNFIADPHQKIYYISDYEANWTFFVELLKILPNEQAVKMYPVCVKTVGEAPKQYNLVSKPVVVDEEFDESMAEEEVAEDITEEAEESVEMDEIEGMSEEGEEESEGELEIGEGGGEEEQKEDEF